ncbi:LysR family transcriptional regulator [Caulobacter mirabilis]|uniref:LysR family transcriptional regulator n=1 Tax=Caulobacter mirabilis TaxID=69666 RepID=A0A2D2B1A5_9CAUL|nr:LysR family transcriptional regulator [Caulobacter mirabilis]ATQ44040.1 LysR family transcriptional regulator [Caulobacter mirabilis]
MTTPDLNLLVALDVLIEEGSVTLAAERLGMSAPSLSRALARIRETVGDPILVRAGRDLAPTPRALEIRDQVHRIVEEAKALLRPSGPVSFAALERQFTIRANEAFAGAFAAALLSRLRDEAPGVTLRFAPEGEADDDALREGRIDLDIGALRAMGPEVRVQTIFRDRYAGVARPDHPIFDAPITPERLAAFEQISASRRGRARGPVDSALGDLGLERRVPLIVGSFHAALFALPNSDLIGLVPRQVVLGIERLGMNLRTFDPPVDLETVVMAQAWHPRLDNDPAHRFLRNAVREVCSRS